MQHINLVLASYLVLGILFKFKYNFNEIQKKIKRKLVCLFMLIFFLLNLKFFRNHLQFVYIVIVFLYVCIMGTVKRAYYYNIHKIGIIVGGYGYEANKKNFQII